MPNEYTPRREILCHYTKCEHIVCNSLTSKNRDCSKCGWNPNVAYKRKEKYLQGETVKNSTIEKAGKS